MDTEQKVAVVTGAGSGIGFGLTKMLLKGGIRVVANDISDMACADMEEQLSEFNDRLTVVQGNAGDIKCIDQIIQKALSAYGRLDIAVANAGITTYNEFLNYQPAQLKTLMDLNLNGTFFLGQRAAREMIHQNIQGRILFLSSVTGFQYHKDLIAYGMTKAAISFLARSLGVELAPHGITVNAIAPGATATERTEKDANFRSTWEEITPNNKVATVEEICKAAMFFLDDAASHVTGQTLIIDGGWTAMSPQPS